MTGYCDGCGNTLCICGLATAEHRSILEEANDIINGDRQTDYGHPVDNHGRTADLWRSYLRSKYSAIVPLDAEDVCFLNILQKISREMHQATRDGLVDIAGYAGNVEKIRER